ncbi:MAG: hypothetical protein PUB18_06275 [bacterium]|nr:hypothetical protein [bacterium]
MIYNELKMAQNRKAIDLDSMIYELLLKVKPEIKIKKLEKENKEDKKTNFHV